MINNNSRFELEQHMVVSSFSDYIRKRDNLAPDDDASVDSFIDDHPDEYKSIQALIALDVAIYLLRRTPTCGGNVDALIHMREQLEIKFNETFDTKFVDYNKGIDW